MRFLTDRTTGKLAKKLRALGFDVLYWGEGQIEEAARAALAEGRVFLTRSRRIPALGNDLRVTVVEADGPREQVREVLQKLRLEPPEGKYFSRCLLCNEELHPVPKEEVEGRVPDFIFRDYDSFHICPRCRRVYWPGTHLEKMKKEVERILSGEDERNQKIMDRDTKHVCRGKEAGGK
jgi:uncharacterized protein with PIN domain